MSICAHAQFLLHIHMHSARDDSERYTCMTFDRALSFRLGTSDDSRRDEAVQRSVVERAGERY